MPILRFDIRIYKKEAIQQAIQAYSNLAKFKISFQKNNAKVIISEIVLKYKDILPDEFSNYVLGMTKKCF